MLGGCVKLGLNEMNRRYAVKVIGTQATKPKSLIERVEKPLKPSEPTIRTLKAFRPKSQSRSSSQNTAVLLFRGWDGRVRTLHKKEYQADVFPAARS